MVFEGTTGVYDLFFVSVPNEYEGTRVRCELEMDFQKSFLGLTF